MTMPKTDQRGFVLMEIVLGLAIMLIVGSIGTFGLISFFQTKWKLDSTAVLNKARDAYLEQYVATGVKPVSDNAACDYSTGQTNCTMPASLAARINLTDAVDGWHQPLLLWSNVTVNGQTFAAAICSSGGDTDYGPVPTGGSHTLAYDPLQQLCSFVNIPADNPRDQTQIAVDTAKSIWTITKSTVDDPGCATDAACVDTMALNGLLPWADAIDQWGHQLRCDTSVNPKVFYSAGPDGCYGSGDPVAACGATSAADNIVNN